MKERGGEEKRQTDRQRQPTQTDNLTWREGKEGEKEIKEWGQNRDTNGALCPQMSG